MVITSGSVVVTGVMTTSTEKVSVRTPNSTKAFRTSCCIFSLLQKNRQSDATCH
ncbi:unknown [Bacteroides sp. CAG:709]|nr:unknown [Bacteroides sp. CAG:709]